VEAMKKGNAPYEGHRARLRARFTKSGIESLGEHEQVEILLTLAIPRRDVKIAAKNLLARFGNLKGILDASITDLRTVKGIGNVAPVALKIIRAAANLYLQQRAENAVVLQSPEALHAFWLSRFGGLRHEVFEVAYLDSAYRLMTDGVQRLQEGTIDRAAVYPRRVLEETLRKGAAAVVLAHNHTNGNAEPSEQDKLVTQAIVNAALSLNVKVLDHMIISGDQVFSFRKAGLL